MLPQRGRGDRLSVTQVLSGRQRRPACLKGRQRPCLGQFCPNFPELIGQLGRRKRLGDRPDGGERGQLVELDLRSLGGDEHHGQGARFGTLLHRAKQRRAVHARHHPVEQHQVGTERGHGGDRGGGVADDLDRHLAHALERQPGDALDVFVVLDIADPVQRSRRHGLCAQESWRGRSNQKVVPPPSRLSKPICPCIISTSRFEIASPSPVPLFWREAVVSGFAKRRKMRRRRASGLPGPRSCTLTRTRRPRSRTAISTVPPSGENLAPLESRLVMTCSSRLRSACTLCSGGGPAISLEISKRTLKRSANARFSTSASRTRSLSENTSGASVSLPDSIFSMSSRSLIRSSSREPFRSATAVSSPMSWVRSPRTPELMSCSEPMIDVRAVRSSWLSVEVNSFFMRSASSWRVTSWPWAITAMTVPSGLTSGVTVHSHTTCRPSRRGLRTLSADTGSRDSMSCAHCRSNSARSSGSTSRSLICRPTISAPA